MQAIDRQLNTAQSIRKCLDRYARSLQIAQRMLLVHTLYRGYFRVGLISQGIEVLQSALVNQSVCTHASVTTKDSGRGVQESCGIIRASREATVRAGVGQWTTGRGCRGQAIGFTGRRQDRSPWIQSLLRPLGNMEVADRLFPSIARLVRFAWDSMKAP